MLTLTPDAQLRLDEYLAELRRVLGTSPAVNPAEVEQDVRDHLSAAFAGRGGPIERSTLDGELQKLGAPSQWLPEEAQPWFRKPPRDWVRELRQSLVRTGKRLTGGPESYRLPYLSLLVLGTGLFVAMLAGDEEGLFAGFVACVTAFILSRAGLALLGHENLSAPQKWLLYPALLPVYVPLLLVMLGAVPVLSGLAIDERLAVQRFGAHAAREQLEAHDAHTEALKRSGGDLSAYAATRERLQRSYDMASAPPQILGRTVTPAVAFGLIVASTGLWLCVLGVVLGLAPGLVRGMFYPFAVGYRRRYGFMLAALGALAAIAYWPLIRPV